MGMHRCGTSVTTEALAVVLDKSEVPGDDFVRGPDNPRGYFESQLLTGFNDRLLQGAGGSWDRPPDLPVDWADQLDTGVVGDARTCFATVFRTDNWIWKDPRTCLTARFWLGVLGDRVDGVVIAFRHPLEVADSVSNSPRGVSRTEALDLWPRYMESALESARGHRTLVTSYRTLFDSPERWLGQVEEFAEDTRFHLVAEPAAVLATVLDQSLRHYQYTPDELSDITPATRLILSRLESLEGVHNSLA